MKISSRISTEIFYLLLIPTLQSLKVFVHSGLPVPTKAKVLPPFELFDTDIPPHITFLFSKY